MANKAKKVNKTTQKDVEAWLSANGMGQDEYWFEPGIGLTQVKWNDVETKKGRCLVLDGILLKNTDEGESECPVTIHVMPKK